MTIVITLLPTVSSMVSRTVCAVQQQSYTMCTHENYLIHAAGPQKLVVFSQELNSLLCFVCLCMCSHTQQLKRTSLLRVNTSWLAQFYLYVLFSVVYSLTRLSTKQPTGLCFSRYQ